jgi:hypothetical protein
MKEDVRRCHRVFLTSPQNGGGERHPLAALSHSVVLEAVEAKSEAPVFARNRIPDIQPAGRHDSVHTR